MSRADRTVQRAAKLHADFTGEPARIVGRVEVPDVDEVLTVVGRCNAIAYTATRDGETAQYQHEFRARSAPTLAVSADGRRLYLIGGAYRFTDRGIEDR